MKNILYLTKPMKQLGIGICFLVLFSGLFYINVALAHYKEPEEGDACPICDMSVINHPLWVAVIMFSDGNHVKFHGSKMMFTYYFNLEKYDKKHRMKNVATLHVTDYYTLKHIRAEKAHYVIHSVIRGAMGEELIPFINRESAEAFTKKHGGNLLLFKDITPEIINSLKSVIPTN